MKVDEKLIREVMALGRNVRKGYQTGWKKYGTYVINQTIQNVSGFVIAEELGPTSSDTWGAAGVTDLELANPVHFFTPTDDGIPTLIIDINILQSAGVIMRSIGIDNYFPAFQTSGAYIRFLFESYYAGYMDQAYPAYGETEDIAAPAATCQEACLGHSWQDTGLGAHDYYIHKLRAIFYKQGLQDRDKLGATNEDLRQNFNNAQLERLIMIMLIRRIRTYVEKKVLRCLQSEITMLRKAATVPGFLRSDLPPSLRELIDDPVWKLWIEGAIRNAAMSSRPDFIGANFAGHAAYLDVFPDVTLINGNAITDNLAPLFDSMLVDPDALAIGRSQAGQSCFKSTETETNFMMLFNMALPDEDLYPDHGGEVWTIGPNFLCFLDFEERLKWWPSAWKMMLKREHFTWRPLLELKDFSNPFIDFSPVKSLHGECLPEMYMAAQQLWSFTTYPTLNATPWMTTAYCRGHPDGIAFNDLETIIHDGDDMIHAGVDVSGVWPIYAFLERYLTPNDYLHSPCGLVFSDPVMRAFIDLWMEFYTLASLAELDLTDADNPRYTVQYQHLTEAVEIKETKNQVQLMYANCSVPRFENVVSFTFPINSVAPYAPYVLIKEKYTVFKTRQVGAVVDIYSVNRPKDVNGTLDTYILIDQQKHIRPLLLMSYTSAIQEITPPEAPKAKVEEKKPEVKAPPTTMVTETPKKDVV